MVEAIDLRGGFAVEIINPDAGIYDNHGPFLLLDVGSHVVQIAFPSKFPPPSTDGFLVFHLDEQFEGKFDDFLLGTESGDFEGIADKDIIDFDVSSHSFWVFVAEVLCKLVQGGFFIISGLNRDQEAEARIDVDWEGASSEVGAAHFARRSGEVLSWGASGDGQ